MPRSGADARRRLQGAALELWSERGYDATTAADIAARAGVTERTFFRHFPDKREVLFDGAAAMQAILVGTLAQAPADLTPFEALRTAFAAVEPLFEVNRAYSGVRQRVIAATPSLRERELAKAAFLASALADGLELRGVERRLAALAAEAAMAAFSHAVASWIEQPEDRLDTHLERAFEHLRTLSAESLGRERYTPLREAPGDGSDKPR